MCKEGHSCKPIISHYLFKDKMIFTHVPVACEGVIVLHHLSA